VGCLTPSKKSRREIEDPNVKYFLLHFSIIRRFDAIGAKLNLANLTKWNSPAPSHQWTPDVYEGVWLVR